MIASDRWKKPVVYAALLLCLLSFFLIVHAWHDYKTSKTNEEILDEAKEEARIITDNALKNISEELNSTSLLADGITMDLSSGKLNNDSVIEKRFLNEIQGNRNILSIAVAYSPAYYGERHSLHLKRNGTTIEAAPINYDYTDDNLNTAVWYINAKRERCGVWNEPFFGVAANTFLLVYSIPFYRAEFRNGIEPAGVIAVTHSLEEVRTQVGNLDLGDTGYGFILSREGMIISHPIQEYLNKNISELAKKDVILDLIGKNTTEKYSVTNPYTNQSSWVIRDKIPSTNWALTVVLPVEQTLLDKKIEQNRSVIKVVLAAFAFFFFLFLLLVSLFRYEDRNLWLLAFIFSSFCALEMGVIFHLTLNVSPYNDLNGDLVVFDMAEVETVLQHSNKSLNAIRIPTGVYIQSLEFSSAYDVILTGYIWQNILKTDADYAYPSFTFPESEETIIEKAYEAKDKGVVGWRFKTTFRQQFDYSKYPFDREDIWIRILNNVSSVGFLTPDFESYYSLFPEYLPGLENSLVLESWEPQRTYFSYRENPYYTSFGVGDSKHSNVTELYYNIDIKRDLKAPFTSDILPVIIVAILLFAVLIITTKDEKKGQCGFSSSEVLGYCSALFFALILVHTSLRNRIPTDSIIYVEYFYIIMYLAILAVSLNSIAFASNANVPFIDTKDNLYVKVLYWPVIMGMLLFITFLNFY